MRLSFDEYALALAETASRRSEDPYFRVGAVVLRADNTIASAGYNGAPSGIEINWEDRDGRRDFVIHAELNALRYVTPNDVTGGLIACTHHPCARCLLTIAAYGLDRVVYRNELDWRVYDRSLCHRLIETCDLEVRQCSM